MPEATTGSVNGEGRQPIAELVDAQAAFVRDSAETVAATVRARVKR